MILEAKYIGPHKRVSVLGFQHRSCERGKTTKIRVSEGTPIGGCWEIVKGKKEYEAGIKAAEAKQKAEFEARAKIRADAKEAELKKLDSIVEASESVKTDSKPQPDKKAGKK